MKCNQCSFQKCNRSYHLICTHPRLRESAKKYQEEKGSINKAQDYIGHRAIKTSLRWCPYKMLLSDEGAHEE